MQSNNKKVQQYTTVQKTQERDNSMEVILSCKKTNIRRQDRNTLLYKKKYKTGKFNYKKRYVQKRSGKDNIYKSSPAGDSSTKTAELSGSHQVIKENSVGDDPIIKMGPSRS